MCLIVERVEVLARVFPSIPIKVEFELVRRLHDPLLLLVTTEILLLDQLKLLLLLAVRRRSPAAEEDVEVNQNHVGGLRDREENINMQSQVRKHKG